MSRQVESLIEAGIEQLEPVLRSRQRNRHTVETKQQSNSHCEFGSSESGECGFSDEAIKKLNEFKEHQHDIEQYQYNLEAKNEMANKGQLVVRNLGEQQRQIRKKMQLLELEKRRNGRKVQFHVGNALNIHDGKFSDQQLKESIQHAKEEQLKHQTFQARSDIHQDMLHNLEQQLSQITHQISKIIRLPAEYRFLAVECVNTTINDQNIQFCPFQQILVNQVLAGTYSKWNRRQDTMLLDKGAKCNKSDTIKTHV